MSTFKVEFTTDNAAFEDGLCMEIAAVLRRIADDVEQYGAPRRSVFDANGNRIGYYEHVPD